MDEARATASSYGVPQDRNRFFLVGNNLGFDFKFPKSFSNKIPVIDAIDDLPELKNGEKLDSAPYKKEPSEYARKLRNGSKFSLQNYVSVNTPVLQSKEPTDRIIVAVIL